MKTYEYDGTESGLEGLLIWWGTLFPFEHSATCEQDDRVLDCCGFGSPPMPYGYSLQAIAVTVKHGGPFPLQLNGPDGCVRLDAGNTINYEDGKFWVE